MLPAERVGRRLRIPEGAAVRRNGPTDPGAGAAQNTDQAEQPEEDPVATDYTVQPGDTLSYIAKQQLGDTSKWKDIYDANSDTIGDDPNMIYPGQVLHLPGGTQADPDQDGYTASGSDSNTGPTWQPGTPVT